MSPLLSALVCVLALLHTCSTAVEAACEYYCVNCVAQTSFPVSSTASTIFTSPCPAGTIFSQSTTTPINLRTAAGSTMQFVVSYQKVGASTSTSVASTNCLQPTDIPSGIALQAVTITAQCTSTSSTSGCEWIGAGQGSCIVPTYSWYAYSWSTCSGACPTGTQTRLVECRYSGTTTTASSSSCNAATKPVTSQSCSLSGCSSSTAIGIMANDPSQGFFVVGAANDNECDPDSDTAKRDLPGLSGTCLQGSSNAHYSSYQVNCYGGNQWQIVWFLDTACAQSDLSVTGKQNECMVVEDKVSILVSCGATSTQATEKFNSAAEDRRQEIQDDKNRKRNTIIIAACAGGGGFLLLLCLIAWCSHCCRPGGCCGRSQVASKETVVVLQPRWEQASYQPQPIQQPQQQMWAVTPGAQPSAPMSPRMAQPPPYAY